MLDHVILVDVYVDRRAGVSVIQLFLSPEFLAEEVHSLAV